MTRLTSKRYELVIDGAWVRNVGLCNGGTGASTSFARSQELVDLVLDN